MIKFYLSSVVAEGKMKNDMKEFDLRETRFLHVHVHVRAVRTSPANKPIWAVGSSVSGNLPAFEEPLHAMIINCVRIRFRHYGSC